MQVLMLTIGSAGDMLPFVGLGAELRRRGHRVTLAGNGHFREYADQESLKFIDFVTAEEYRREVLERKDWSLRSSRLFGVRRTTEKLEPAYRLVSEAVEQDPHTVVLSHVWVLGARIAREKYRFPLFTCHLQPSTLTPSRRAVRELGWRRRLRLAVANFITDRMFGKPVNEFRGRLGLPPVQRLLQEWWHGPEGVFGIFPEWFGAMRPHELPQFRYLGFSRYDQRKEAGPQTDLAAFLNAGEPPIVFSSPSFIPSGPSYRTLCLETAQRLKQRAIFLGQAADISAPRSDLVGDFAYVPLSQLLSHCRAHVHHGGMGTLAATLAAGIPQVAIPAVSDQPDNARRLEEIGVARVIPRKKLTVDRLKQALTDVLTSDTVRAACAFRAELVRTQDPFVAGADRIEEVARSEFANSSG